jgi:hypothetical protein
VPNSLAKLNYLKHYAEAYLMRPILSNDRPDLCDSLSESCYDDFDCCRDFEIEMNAYELTDEELALAANTPGFTC